MEFNERLRAARMSRKLTQQQMADAVGIQMRSYQKYEQGTSEPCFDYLAVIADKLDVPTDWLLCRDDYLESLGVSVDAPRTCPPVHPRAQRRL